MARGSTERKSRPRWAGRDPSAAGRATPPGGLRGILGRDDSGPESGGAGLLRPAEGAGEAGQDHSKPGASPGQSCGARPRSSHGGTHRQHQPVDTPRAAAQPQQQEQPRPPLRGAPAGEPPPLARCHLRSQPPTGEPIAARWGPTLRLFQSA